MALWPLYLGLQYHRPFVFLTAQRSGWDRHLSSAGPLGGAWDALVAGWRAVRQLVAGSGHTYFSNPDHSAMYYAGLNLEQLAYAVLLVALGVYAWRVLGAAYGIFVLGSLALPFSDPVPITPLLSMPRFALGVFPVFLVLGKLGARPRLNTAISSASPCSSGSTSPAGCSGSGSPIALTGRSRRRGGRSRRRSGRDS